MAEEEKEAKEVTTHIAPPPAPGTVPCPWCGTEWTKDEACNWVCCGLVKVGGKDTFLSYVGCGRQFCFRFGRKLCGTLYGAEGKIAGVADSHTASCDCVNDGTHCPGGHNSHCPPRWGCAGAS